VVAVEVSTPVASPLLAAGGSRSLLMPGGASWAKSSDGWPEAGEDSATATAAAAAAI